MSYCTNCNARLTCGCQKRVSNKGVAGCATCIGQLNAGTTPEIQTAPRPSNIAPTKVTAKYIGPGTQI
jgi:hypothetical protein